MKTSIFFLVLMLNFGLFNRNLALSNHIEMNIINIQGLIVDSKSLSPVKGASIYDDKGKQLCVSDENGFFNAELSIEAVNEIRFTLKVKKLGYESFLQNEHWAILKSPIGVAYYFGLKESHSGNKAFSELVMGGSSQEELAQGLGKIKDKINLENKIEIKKAGNNDLFFTIDDDFYLINDSGWIKLKSAKELILVNGQQRLAANEINHYIKREKVKKMSPSSKAEAAYEIETY